MSEPLSPDDKNELAAMLPVSVRFTSRGAQPVMIPAVETVEKITGWIEGKIRAALATQADELRRLRMRVGLLESALKTPYAKVAGELYAATARIAELEKVVLRLKKSGPPGASDHGDMIWDAACSEADALLATRTAAAKEGT